MLLAVDIGNSNIVCGLYRGDELVATFRFETMRSRTDDEQAALLSQLLALRQISPTDIHAAIVSSVVPPLTDVLAGAIQELTGVHPQVVGGPGLKTGIRIRCDNPREVGADRIVNAVAAFERVRGAVVVVDFGTATNFDCVSADGEYQGGVLVPGVQISLDALVSRAAKLSRIEIGEPPRVIGRNTQHAMQSGIIHGYSSLVDGLLEKIAAEFDTPFRTLATGGLAPLICRHTKRVDEVLPNLTLDGLLLIHRRNAHGSRGEP
ncbi:MAG TPA: type III pantothenate kinase [Polyangiaceae bacterium]|nr:type III pantothenate kinase [Polyangiaceae bacterium]